jgi:hypothetical protein
MIQPGIVAAQSSGAPATPVTRVYDGRSALGEVANDQDAPAELLRWTYTPPGAGDYIVFWSMDLQPDITGLSLGAIGYVLEDDVEIDRVIHQNETWRTCGGFFRHVSDGSPVTWSLAMGRRNAFFGAGPGKARNAYLTVLQLTAADEYAESLGATGGVGSYADQVTLSFTPGSPGAYLLLGFGVSYGAVPVTFTGLRLSDGADDSGEISQAHLSTSERWAAVVPWVRPVVTGAQTFRLQRNDSAVMASARLLALRLDGFTHGYRATLAADNASAATSYVAGLQIARNVPATDFLALAAWQTSGTAGDNYSRLIDDVATVCETVGGVRQVTLFAARLMSSSAGRHAWRVERKSAAGISKIEQTSVLALLQLT